MGFLSFLLLSVLYPKKRKDRSCHFPVSSVFCIYQLNMCILCGFNLTSFSYVFAGTDFNGAGCTMTVGSKKTSHFLTWFLSLFFLPLFMTKVTNLELWQGDTKGSARGGETSVKRDTVAPSPSQNPQVWFCICLPNLLEWYFLPFDCTSCCVVW